MLERVSPAQLRKALELAHAFAKLGVNFVPVPVASEEERLAVAEKAMAKLNEIAVAAGKDSEAGDARPLTRCAAARDGECRHAQCPQLRDNEPAATVRHCPLDNDIDGDAAVFAYNGL